MMRSILDCIWWSSKHLKMFVEYVLSNDLLMRSKNWPHCIWTSLCQVPFMDFIHSPPICIFWRIDHLGNCDRECELGWEHGCEYEHYLLCSHECSCPCHYLIFLWLQIMNKLVPFLCCSNFKNEMDIDLDISHLNFN